MKHATLSRFASLAASAALALSLAACGSTSRSTYSAAVSNDTAAFSSQDAGDYEYYSAESAAAGEGSSFSSDDLTSSMLDPSTVESSRKIVYNASVRMETTDYDTTRAALQEAVTAANGYLESTDQGGSKDSGSRYTYYTARIPAENYRSFLTAAGEAGNVTSLNESAQDITAEYVDVEARLKALNDQRDRLNALADKAETTADLLEIESQLSDVQYQLESYTGQMRLMDNQVRYSTVDISLQEVQVLTPTATTFGEKFVEAVTSGWRGRRSYPGGGLPVAGGTDRACHPAGGTARPQAPQGPPGGEKAGQARCKGCRPGAARRARQTGRHRKINRTSSFQLISQSGRTVLQ